MDRNSEEYRQGQRDARREAAITTGAGIASAVAIPAVINAATTYIITENPEGEGNVAHIPMQQDGGEVTETSNGVRLTRRQAMDLSKQNKGYNNNQYITAYYNALDSLRRNSTLRGRDLRNQARIMASGVSDGLNST